MRETLRHIPISLTKSHLPHDETPATAKTIPIRLPSAQLKRNSHTADGRWQIKHVASNWGLFRTRTIAG